MSPGQHFIATKPSHTHTHTHLLESPKFFSLEMLLGIEEYSRALAKPLEAVIHSTRIEAFWIERTAKPLTELFVFRVFLV